MKILFCNIAWMEWYKGVLPYDMPVNGGAYIKENRDGADCDNFWAVENFEPYRINKDTVIPIGNIMMGYVATGSTRNGDAHQIKLERIQGCEACKDVDSIEDVLVVFCATRVGERRPFVVGWYKHATVLRNIFEYDLDGGEDLSDFFENDLYIHNVLYKNIFCREEDAVLLPVNLRKWHVPRASIDKYGFGQSNVWYADYEQDERVQPWVEDIVAKINSYDGPNIRDELPMDPYDNY